MLPDVSGTGVPGTGGNLGGWCPGSMDDASAAYRG